jgi:hypothetical protein
MTQITCPHCRDTYPDLDAAHVCSRGIYAPKFKSIINERIRQLAEQATTYIEPTYSSGEGWIFDKEKFAELIVRECAGLFPNVYVEIENEYEYGHTPVIAADYIKKHFGVEEQTK